MCPKAPLYRAASLVHSFIHVRLRNVKLRFFLKITKYTFFQILVMVHDSLQDIKQQPRWKKAFRVTVQKCLLGAVILATGSRAIYYTIQSLIPDKWGDILLNVYYPSLLSAISLLICFWAEVSVLYLYISWGKEKYV